MTITHPRKCHLRTPIEGYVTLKKYYIVTVWQSDTQEEKNADNFGVKNVI